nr:DUF222 domain-containing protein [Promicromonospora kroppenstedtii]
MVDVGPTSEDRRKALVSPVDAAPRGTGEDEPANDGDEATANGADGSGADDGEPAGPAGGDPAGDGAGAVVHGPTGEEVLLDLADQHGPLVFRRFVDRFVRVADPESDERGYKRAWEREHLEVAKTFGGYHVAGFLTDEHGEALRTAMDSVMGAPTPGDARTPTQRRAQALADLARTVLDNGHTGTGGAVRPHVTVTVSWTELARLTGRSGAPGSSESGSGRGAGPSDGGRVGDHDHEADRLRLKELPGTGGSTSLTDVTAAPARFGISASLVPTSTLRRLLCDAAVTGGLRTGQPGARRRSGAAHRHRADAPGRDRPGQTLRLRRLHAAARSLRGPPRRTPLGRRWRHERA